MTRNLFTALLLSTILAGAAPSPARAQETEAHIAQALQTLNQITQLIQSVQARQAGLAQPAGRESADGWQSLFDGKSLDGWKRTDFADGGSAHVDPGFRGGAPAIVVVRGEPLSGITWTKDVPTSNYEITLEAMKIDGDDFMCALTFPVGATHASLILGGWGGTVAGISSLDNLDASENETSKVLAFPKDHWFAVRMRVTPNKLETWLDGKKIVDVSTADKKVGLRFGEISKSRPLGIATYRTSSAFRAIKIRRIEP